MRVLKNVGLVLLGAHLMWTGIGFWSMWKASRDLKVAHERFRVKPDTRPFQWEQG